MTGYREDQEVYCYTYGGYSPGKVRQVTVSNGTPKYLVQLKGWCKRILVGPEDLIEYTKENAKNVTELCKNIGSTQRQLDKKQEPQHSEKNSYKQIENKEGEMRYRKEDVKINKINIKSDTELKEFTRKLNSSVVVIKTDNDVSKMIHDILSRNDHFQVMLSQASKLNKLLNDEKGTEKRELVTSISGEESSIPVKEDQIKKDMLASTEVTQKNKKDDGKDVENLTSTKKDIRCTSVTMDDPFLLSVEEIKTMKDSIRIDELLSKGTSIDDELLDAKLMQDLFGKILDRNKEPTMVGIKYISEEERMKEATHKKEEKLKSLKEQERRWTVLWQPFEIEADMAWFYMLSHLNENKQLRRRERQKRQKQEKKALKRKRKEELIKAKKEETAKFVQHILEQNEKDDQKVGDFEKSYTAKKRVKRRAFRKIKKLAQEKAQKDKQKKSEEVTQDNFSELTEDLKQLGGYEEMSKKPEDPPMPKIMRTNPNAAERRRLKRCAKYARYSRSKQTIQNVNCNPHQISYVNDMRNYSSYLSKQPFYKMKTQVEIPKGNNNPSLDIQKEKEHPLSNAPPVFLLEEQEEVNLDIPKINHIMLLDEGTLRAFPMDIISPASLQKNPEKGTLNKQGIYESEFKCSSVSPASSDRRDDVGQSINMETFGKKQMEALNDDPKIIEVINFV